MNHNCYLYRAPDLSGSVYFYFNPVLGGIELRTDVISSTLLYEMVHAFQSYTEQETWNATQLNRELEAHLRGKITRVDYFYYKRFPESGL